MATLLSNALLTARFIVIMAATVVAATCVQAQTAVPVLPKEQPRLLTDPYLQNPGRDHIYVAWVSNFKGRSHAVLLDPVPISLQAHPSPKAKLRAIGATSAPLTRLFEDSASRLASAPKQVSRRLAFRHQALIGGLQPGMRYRYWAVSTSESGDRHQMGPFTLSALPQPKQPLRILLTSDQQERFNTLANYQIVADQFPQLDAILFAGDMVNHPRRGSEWFDNLLPDWLQDPLQARPSFFPTLQGNFDALVPTSPYKGGELLQHVPLFPAIANHEVSGRFRPNQVVNQGGKPVVMDINAMFADAQPRWYAAARYETIANQVNPSQNVDVKQQWLRDHSHDFDSYRELFTLPSDGPEGESYYSKRIGDVFVIALNVSRIWRNWRVDAKSKFAEHPTDLNHPDAWGFGEHIFTPFKSGSTQYHWLKRVLASEDFKQSRFRVVMFHQAATGLGDNAVPVLTDPVMTLDYRDQQGAHKTRQVVLPTGQQHRIEVWRSQVQPLLGSITSVRYDYPIDDDYFRRDIEPLLQQAGVQLVLHGHSHIWNRTRVGDMHYLETSAAGNCFGAHWQAPDGTAWQGKLRGATAFFNAVAQGQYDGANYPRTNDPHGRVPIMPNRANPMQVFGLATEPVPFVCDNGVSTFSILDTELAAVRSFAINLNEPKPTVLEFDRLLLE